MEYLDILDEDGNRTGEKKDKRQVYKDGNWHRSVHIWIINSNNEILVQKRHPKKETFPNLWAISVAGHVQSGEDSIDASIREVKEEINVTINREDLIYLFTLKRTQEYMNGHINVIDDIYLLRLDIDVEKTKLQRSELSDIKYIHYKELENHFKNNNPLFVPQTEEQIKLFRELLIYLK